MERRPAIAVAAPNVLMGVGMKSILEKIIPAADAETAASFLYEYPSVPFRSDRR